jgi:hypothetical protein
VPPFELLVEQDGKTYRVTARVSGTAVHVDKLDPANAIQRSRFARTVHEACPTLPAEAVERELLRIAVDGAPDPAPPPVVADELDVSLVHRPELFHAAGVSGLAIPITTSHDGKPETRWHLYLQWRTGTRDARPLPGFLDRPDGTRLWLHPAPGEPGVGTPSGWSRHARRAWLAGASRPDPAILFRNLSAAIADYLEFPPDAAVGTTATIALWVLLTYGYTAWPAVPYLYVGGPMASGKSRLFDLLARLVFRPLASANLTGPALFRTLHDRGGTLLYDEAERLRQSTPDVQELLSMLLAGYSRGGKATRLEAVGDSFRPVSFDVFGPKAVACIQGLPPTLASRCIQIFMFRAGPESPKPRRRIDADSDRWQRLRDDLHALALDAGPDWRDLSSRADVCPAKISGRDFELWQPLLALAAWVESFGAEGLLALVQRHALATVADNKDEGVPETDELLLEVIAQAVRAGRWLTSREILDEAKQKAQGLFKSWEHARTVTARLKTYGLRQGPKSNGRAEFRLTTADLLRVQRHYGLDLGMEDGHTIPDFSPL